MSKIKRYIDNQTALDEWCQTQLKNSTLLAIDTEFMRVKTYFPKLCLIQLATRQEMVCIDPLMIRDLSSLKTLLSAPNILKVIHSAHQDLETLVHDLDLLPEPLYDTQIAISRLKICDHLISYQDMVAHFLNVELAKDQTRTQWDKRPLTKRQIDYAYDDVRYLLECYDAIDALVTKENLAHQLTDDFIPLTQIERYQPDLQHAWKRVKGKNRLNRKERALLQLLAENREILAIKKNLPKRWIVKDDKLIDLSRKFVNEKHLLEEDTILTSYNDDIKTSLQNAIIQFRDQSESA